MEKGKRYQGSCSWANIGPADQRKDRAGILFDRQKDYHLLAWKGILLEGRDRIFVIQTAAAFLTSFSALLMEAQDLLNIGSMAPLSSNKEKEERWLSCRLKPLA
ncbi:hypothetical protein LIER_43118 [Lithospermum erythrorhizon]|uniref:Uncharacterized protein n=1 Tax=Lithospermum erythrorhizon TaxID=34254 RepID=A0AAV3PJH1_LITER